MTRRGHTLVEAIATALGLLAILVIAMPTLAQPGRAARFLSSQDNLRFWGAAKATYTADFGGLMPAYSWLDDQVYHVEGTGDVFIPGSGNNFDASAWEEVDILRRLTGRATGPDRVLLLRNFYPHRRRTHLVVADHIGLTANGRRAADPQDRNQLVWQRDPLAFEDNADLWPLPINGADFAFDSIAAIQRWPYSSSYQVTVSSWSFDRRTFGMNTVAPSGGSSNFFTQSALPIGRRWDFEVAFPGQRVFMFEWHDRHSAPQALWYAYPQARPNKLMFDGAVQARPTGEAGQGFNPNDPDNPNTFFQVYSPLTTDPPHVGDPNDEYPVWYRFTRDGLAGIDYAP